MRRCFARGLSACLLFLCMALPASATQTGAVTLGFEELKASIETHPAFLEAKDALAAADAHLSDTARWDDPTLGLSTGWAEALEGDHRGRSAEAELEFGLRLPGRQHNAVARAHARRDAAMKDLDGLRRELFSGLAVRFWEIARDQEWRRRVDVSRQALVQSLDIAKRRVDLGEARPVDLLRFEIELARLESEIRAERAAAAARRRNLARWMGMSPDQELRVDRVFELPGEPLSFDELLARQERSHPSIQAGELRSAAAEAGLRAERWGRLPDPSLRVFAAQELDSREIGLGIALALPLWNRNAPAVAVATADASAARHEAERNRLELAESLESARARLVFARELARALEEEILPKAVRAAEVLERMYEIGEVGVLEVIEARRSLMETELDGLGALLECHLAHLDLQTLTGESCHENEIR